MTSMSMRPKIVLTVMVALIGAGLLLVDRQEARAGEVGGSSGYKVLEPIRHGNLTVFPVVAAKNYPTGEFLTLDEGLRLTVDWFPTTLPPGSRPLSPVLLSIGSSRSGPAPRSPT